MSKKIPSAEELISILHLEPHPEGGAFKETYRSSVQARTQNERSVGTAIYFLIRHGRATAWHKVTSDEIYHFYCGAPAELSVISPEGVMSKQTLGTDVQNRERPQILIPANYWQSVSSLGEYTLMGCTVSPGFDFSDFEMIEIEQLKNKYPELNLN